MILDFIFFLQVSWALFMVKLLLVEPISRKIIFLTFLLKNTFYIKFFLKYYQTDS